MQATRTERAKTRSQRASSLLEVPVSLWMVFVVFFIPMFSLASITLQTTLLNISLQDAVQAASKSRTFTQDSDEGPSASNVAKEVFQAHKQLFPSLATANIELDILQTQINGNTTSRFPTAMQTPANTDQFVYQVEGLASASIEPLLKLNDSLFGNIPGLTAPINVSFRARQMFENAQGLNR